MRKFFVLLMVFAMIFTSNTFADTHNQFIKSFDKWRVFTKQIEGKKQCSIISEPMHSTGFPGFRDVPHAIFTSVKGGDFTFSIYAGFIINKNEPIQIFVGDKILYLKLYKDFFGYTYNSKDDIELLNTLLKNKATIRVRTVNKDMEVANDYYDFKSLDKAFEFVRKNYRCD